MNKKRLNSKRINRIKNLEKIFSYRNYEGKGKNTVETVKGTSVIALFAPYSVNCGNNKANVYTGGLSKLLALETGSHSLSIGRSYSNSDERTVFQKLADYIEKNQLKLFIDLRSVSTSTDGIIFLSNEDDNEGHYAFVNRAIRYSLEYQMKKQGLSNAVVNDTEIKDKRISFLTDKDVAYICLGINDKYLNPKNKEGFSLLYEALYATIELFSNLDWEAEKIKVYKLWQSSRHKPQDKIEICFNQNDSFFENGNLLNICSHENKLEKVRLYTPSEKTTKELSNNPSVNLTEYIFLTNRLIEILFKRDWIEGKEEEPGLKEAPVFVYSDRKEIYPIGLPIANKIDRVYFSSELFNEKKIEAQKFDYFLFNRYTDSRLYVDFEKMDYSDYGRVKTEDGHPAKRVMIPRYYKKLLGYMDYPLKMIRAEEYDCIIEKLDDAEKNAFFQCYEKINNEVFYKLREEYVINSEGNIESSLDPKKKEIIEIVKCVQKEKLELNKHVEVVRIPKEIKPNKNIIQRFLCVTDQLNDSILNLVIGKSEYLLKVEWTSETDDRNNIARLSPNMMSLLGVSENDKILVKFGRKQQILRVLANGELTDYQIGVPAPARRKLGMNSINDIVIVHRDMKHIFKNHSQEQALTIFGTILTVSKLTDYLWLNIILCFVVAPIIMYLVLNAERVKVK